MTQIITQNDLKDPLWWRSECKDLFFTCRAVLSTAWPDKMKDFGSLQLQMCNFLEPSHNPSKKKLLSVYRESLKTTVLLGFVTWLFAWYHVKKEPTIINYNTATVTNATSFMDDFRHTLLNCPLLQAAFDLPSRKEDYDSWTKSLVKLGHVRFTVSSFDEQQASRHARIIINDDLVNEMNYFTEHSREDTKRKWRYQKSVSSQIKATDLSMEIDVGTPYHYDDLMWHLMKKNKTYDKFIVACVKGWPDVTVSDVIGRTKPLSNPEIMTYEKLIEKYEEQQNSIFSSQYCLRPLAEADALCQERWIHYWNNLPPTAWRTMVIDPGGSVPGVSDPTGITICDCDPQGNLYVAYAEEIWLTTKQIVKTVKDLMDQYKPDDTRVEKEKYAITIADIFEDDFRRYNISFVEHKHRDKDSRIWRLRQWFEKGRIFIHDTQKTLFDQLVQYPQTTRDDILDSLSYHLDILRVPKETAAPRFEPKIEVGFAQEFDDYMQGIQNKRQGGLDYDASY